MSSPLSRVSRFANILRSNNRFHLASQTPVASLHVSSVDKKEIPNNLKGKSSSSVRWLTRQINDPYVKKARYEQYRARSAYKLIEIDDKYKLLKPGMVVVECGAAPGAWTQVLTRRLKLTDSDGQQEVNCNSLVISIDRNPFQSVPGAVNIPNSDFTSPIGQAKILSALDDRKVDLVCSDMAPNATGIAALDHQKITELILAALQFSLSVLRVEGAFLTKIWDGERTDKCIDLMEKFFTQVKRIKPDSSRDDSSELFILARGFRGTVQTNG